MELNKVQSDIRISKYNEMELNFLKTLLQRAEITFSIYETDAGDVLEIPFGAWITKDIFRRGTK